MDDTSLRTKLLLSVQRAMLDTVTPNLRGVGVDWDDSLIRLIVYFDGPLSDDDRETFSVVHTEVLTDFVDLRPVELILERRDAPKGLDGCRAWAFLRKEHNHGGKH